MSWFSQKWNELTGVEDDPKEPIQRIEVIWNRERLKINLPRSSSPATLHDLKDIISQKSSIPYHQIKLIYQGLILKDDKASLAAYGLRNGSRLMLVGTQGGGHGDMPGAKSSLYEGGSGEKKISKGEELARLKKQNEQDVSEDGLLRRIEETVSGVRKDLVPEVEEFLKTGKSRAEARAERANSKEARSAEEVAAANQRSKATIDALGLRQRKLSELLLRALLTLDGISVNSDETRKKRKEAVKEIQNHLDRVDETWQAIKAEQTAAR
ncbi:hypothetical protein CBS101457_005139 [Exobasidium rhododendri]|nr:hypothetical protein CBS101457_005139 [Exobasidium rhododendri]